MDDRARRLKNNFNLTIEEWDIIDAFQNHVCFICRKKQKSGKRLAVDHRHKPDGLIRGLLCASCNRLLGKIENMGWTFECLDRVKEYLINPPAVQALDGREIFTFPGRLGTKRHRKYLRKLKKSKINN